MVLVDSSFGMKNNGSWGTLSKKALQKYFVYKD